MLHLDGADRDAVPALVGNDVTGFEASHPGDEGGFVPVGVDRHGVAGE